MKKKLTLCAMFLLATGALVSPKISAMEPITPNFDTINTNNTNIINTNTNNNALEKAKIQLMPEEICNINKFIKNIKIDAKHVHNNFNSTINQFKYSFEDKDDKDRYEFLPHIINGYPKSYNAFVGKLERKLDALKDKIDKKDYDNYKKTIKEIFELTDNFKKILKSNIKQPNFINDIIKKNDEIYEEIEKIQEITISKIPETQQAAPISFYQLEKSLNPFHDLENLIKNTKNTLDASFNIKDQPFLRLFGCLMDSRNFFEKFKNLLNSSTLFNDNNYKEIKYTLRILDGLISDYESYYENCDKNNTKCSDELVNKFIEKFIDQLNKISKIIIQSRNDVAPAALSKLDIEKSERLKSVQLEAFNFLFEQTEELIKQFNQEKINLDEIKGKISYCENSLNKVKSRFIVNDENSKSLMSILDEGIKPILDDMKKYFDDEKNLNKSKDDDVWVFHSNPKEAEKKYDSYRIEFSARKASLFLLFFGDFYNFK